MKKILDVIKEQRLIIIHSLLGMWVGLLMYLLPAALLLFLLEEVKGSPLNLESLSPYSWEIITMWAGAAGATFISKRIGPPA